MPVPVADAQSYAADFLTLGTDARPLGMGNAFIAIADAAHTASYNPAGISQLTQHEVNFMHATLANLTAYDVASYTYPLSTKMSFALSWLRIGVDDIPVTAIPVTTKAIGPNNRPYIANTFSTTQHAFFLSGARHLLTLPYNSTLHLGASLKLLYIDTYRNTNAIGIGSDLGILVKTDMTPTHTVSCGLVATDFFTTKLYWNTPPTYAWDTPHTETRMPHLKIGVASQQKLPFLKSALTLAADMDAGNAYQLHAGAEYVLFDLLALRCGLAEHNGTSRTLAFTAGAGLRLRFVTGTACYVDYAYQPHTDLGVHNRLSLRVVF